MHTPSTLNLLQDYNHVERKKVVHENIQNIAAHSSFPRQLLDLLQAQLNSLLHLLVIFYSACTTPITKADFLQQRKQALYSFTNSNT